MSEITPFNFNGHAVRVIIIDGEPWWVAADVCEALEISNVGNVLARLDGDDIRRADVVDSVGRRNPNTNVINESGLYELIIRSDRPAAKEFRRWITAEVLPSIRKTGSYSVGPQDDLSLLEGMIVAIRADRVRLAAVEQRVEVLEENHDRVAAIGYASLRGIRSDVAYLNKLGRQASTIARRDAVPVSRVHSTVWGEVNAWPLEIWDEALARMNGAIG